MGETRGAGDVGGVCRKYWRRQAGSAGQIRGQLGSAGAMRGRWSQWGLLEPRRVWWDGGDDSWSPQGVGGTTMGYI